MKNTNIFPHILKVERLKELWQEFHSLFVYITVFFQEEYTTVLGTICIYSEEINTNFWSSHLNSRFVLYIFSYLFMFSQFS